jgi:hypothetical protein
MLDAEHARVKQRVDAELQRQPYLQMSTDGWRRGHVGEGVPLINVMALKPDNGAVFVKAEPARGVVKDAAWITAQHLRWAEELTGGNLEKFLGIVMDNTKVCKLRAQLLLWCCCICRQAPPRWACSVRWHEMAAPVLCHDHAVPAHVSTSNRGLHTFACCSTSVLQLMEH